MRVVPEVGGARGEGRGGADAREPESGLQRADCEERPMMNEVEIVESHKAYNAQAPTIY